MNNVRRKHVVKAVITLVFGGIYLLNPTGGIVEFLPDVFPIVGNLDEATAMTFMLYGVREFRGSSGVLSVN